MMKILKLTTLFILSILYSHSIQGQEKTIYSNDKYIWESSKMIQNGFEGQALSPTHIKSNYISPLQKEGDERYEWALKNDISSYPQYSSSFPLENAIYNMGLDEMVNAVEPFLTLRTGTDWAGVWTRDVSYSIILSMSYLQPTASKNSLLHKINSLGKIIQDTGTGGSWPCSSDRLIWVVAAWELYKVTGDYNWIQSIYSVIKASFEDDFAIVYDKETGLVRGESSFIDWRDQSYPKWMQPADIYQSKALGTNAVHYQALRDASQIADLLNKGDDAAFFQNKAEQLKAAINKYFWMPDKGYYAQFLYGRQNNIVSPRSETLGESLCILFDIASQEQKKTITQKMPVVSYGPSIFYPQIADMGDYHNNGIWPFVTSYWTLASAKVKNEESVLHAIGSTYRAAAIFTTNKENFVADNGDWKGTHINSSNMLWSLSGNLSIVYNILFGINFDTDRMTFNPFVPKTLAGKRKLSGFRYRNATLDIEINGYGDEIKSFTINGKKTNPMIMGSLEGKHDVKIELSNRDIKKLEMNLVPNKSSLLTPLTKIDNGTLLWDVVPEAASYTIIKDGKKMKTQNSTSIKLKEKGEYQVIANCNDAIRNSFASEPLIWTDFGLWTYDIGKLKISKSENTRISVPIAIDKDGEYAIDWLYANGNGPVSQENKCAIRNLVVDDETVGATIFPQREEDNWDNTGWSNIIKYKLKKGEHTIQLVFNSQNENMNIEVNEAIIHQLRLYLLPEDKPNVN